MKFRSLPIFYSGNVEKSLCTLERIEAIISDCKGSTTEPTVESYGTREVIEAAIITFKHEVTVALKDPVSLTF